MYFHHDYDNGSTQLNIEFTSEAKEVISKLYGKDIRVMELCAFWEQ